jgi:hypothetical protein
MISCFWSVQAALQFNSRDRCRLVTNSKDAIVNSLHSIAHSAGSSDYVLPSGRRVRIATLHVRFPPAEPSRLASGVLQSTYTSKPLVDVDGESLFGELAIVRWLAKDGWDALWVDTFHGRKFWREMPHMGPPVSPPPQVRSLYDRIAQTKGSPSGCFDIVAWSESRIIWLEYKGPRDKPNRNEALWIEAALQSGVEEKDLFFVGAHQR